jgi:probable addiction module antidote protein
VEKSNLSQFDVVEYLDSPEARLEYMRAALETEDAAFIMDALGVVARAAGMSRIASEAGRGRESLYKALRADGNPEFETVLRVMHAVGLRLTAEPAATEPEPA